MTIFSRTITIFIGLMSLVSFSYADAGIPMIIFTFPEMLLALIPIVFIEALLYRRFLHSKFKLAIIPSLKSNIVSTIAGIPLAWIFHMIAFYPLMAIFAPKHNNTIIEKIIAAFFTSAWMWPNTSWWGNDKAWMMSFAAIIGLIPAYFVSVWIEYKIVQRYFNNLPKNVNLKRVVWKVNAVTYLLLLTFGIALLIISIIKRDVLNWLF